MKSTTDNAVETEYGLVVSKCIDRVAALVDRQGYVFPGDILVRPSYKLLEDFY